METTIEHIGVIWGLYRDHGITLEHKDLEKLRGESPKWWTKELMGRTTVKYLFR